MIERIDHMILDAEDFVENRKLGLRTGCTVMWNCPWENPERMTSAVSRSREGLVEVPGGRVWYRIVGAGNSVPLLTLHGGPGAGHDYLEPLEALATDRPVVFFDQLGSGKSDHPADRSLWRIDRFVDEVRALRKALGLDRIHLLGHSWGGWLAIEYMLGNPVGIESLVLASTSASLPEVAREIGKLKAALPRQVLDVLERYEALGDYHNPEYEAAAMEFYRRHVCRLDPWPQPLVRSLTNMTTDPVAYETIQGPNEFTITGNLKDWDRVGRLNEIHVPTLVTAGRYDELGPACAETLHQGIAKSQMVVFERSAHMAMWEETDHYLEVVGGFLNRRPSKSRPARS